MIKGFFSNAVLATILALAVLVVDRAGTVGLVASAQAQGSSDGKKKERETRRTPALRNKVYEKLAEAQAFAEAKDYPAAQQVLDQMIAGEGKRALNSYELANVYNLYAFLRYSAEDYSGALRYYRQVIAQPDIPLAMEIGTRFTVAQLYFVQEQWQPGIDALLEWFELTDKPNATAYILLAQGYYQLKDYDSALKNVETAISMHETEGKLPRNLITTSPTTRENFYGFVFEGELKVPRDGAYEFAYNADDGVRLLLRRHVGRCSTPRRDRTRRSLAGERARQPPVHQIDLAEAPEHHVARLHVAVDHPVLVRERQRVADLDHDRHRLGELCLREHGFKTCRQPSESECTCHMAMSIWCPLQGIAW